MNTVKLTTLVVGIGLAGPAIAARSSTGFVVPDCDRGNPACLEWRQAVEIMNQDGATLDALSGTRPGRPLPPTPAYMKSMDACVRYFMSPSHKMAQAAAKSRCQKLMSKSEAL
jgi:hypothetical protein